ncbi:ISL3 family transposase [Lacticaseibacillus paracasei]|uniref:ISL3 family transposase n=1 Tax=Lacticaseibacillus paracasei TaxID=1597 RepID=UPI0039FD9054
MSQYDPTLSVLGIPDHNIKVAFVRHEYRGNGVRRRQNHVIDAELTYRLTRYPLCGFEALHPNGFYTAHVRILNGIEMPTVIDLHKQRWRCHNCYHTVSAKTPLVQPNHTIAAHMTERIMKLAHERLPVKTIARIIGISASSVQRIIDQNLKLRPARRLPTRLCFDEFRSTHGMMSFICLDADSHRLIALLGDRFNRTIKNFFIAHYSLADRTRVQTVTMDMNAAYQTIIHEVFPKAQVVIDRFHIIQLAARALDQVRVQALKQLDDKHSRPYKIMKTNWRLFHQTAPDAKHKQFLFGLNEDVKQQEAIDIALDTEPKLKQTYETYLALHEALMVKKHPAELANLLATYEPNGTAMDMTIATLKRHQVAVLAAVTSPYSNGPIEGVNRLIKSLKRSCFGFKNQLNFFKRIYQITA